MARPPPVYRPSRQSGSSSAGGRQEEPQQQPHQQPQQPPPQGDPPRPRGTPSRPAAAAAAPADTGASTTQHPSTLPRDPFLHHHHHHTEMPRRSASPYHDERPSSAGPTTRETTPSSNCKPPPTRKKAVGWNQNLFVVGTTTTNNNNRPATSSSSSSSSSPFTEAPPPPTRRLQRALSPPRNRVSNPRTFAPIMDASSHNHNDDLGSVLQPPTPSSSSLSSRTTTSTANIHTSVSSESPVGRPNHPPDDARPALLLSRRRRKQSLIVDKDTRDTRWNWTRLRVSQTLEPYRLALCQEDELLPDTNEEFQQFQQDHVDTEKLSALRDTMLDDKELTEQQVAAFFEGFSLFQMKVRSLQSQLESAKALGGGGRDDRVSRMRSMRAMSMAGVVGSASRDESLARYKPSARSSLMPAVTKQGNRTDPDVSRGASTTAPPRAFGKSLRALSIKKVQKDHSQDEKVQRLLKELEDAERKHNKLEKQLQQAGVVIAQDIPYDEAKSNVERIAKRLQEIGSSDASDPKLREEYFKLEQDMEKYTTALQLTDEYIEEQEELERTWEDDNAPANIEALKMVRRHMPVDVKSMSESQLSADPTPNGKVLPRAIARKFKRTNVLQLLRVNPEDIVRMHPSTIENYRVTGLTLTERRAMYAHLLPVGPRWKAMQADPMTERKWVWYQMMRQNFKENLSLYQHHVSQYGPAGNHPYATRENPDGGCPMIGKQCPLKADKIIDYDGDYGYTDADQYEMSHVQKADAEDPGAKAKREALELARGKRTNGRTDALKKHYKGNVLQVSLASGSCEAMDDIMDRIDAWQTKWIEERVRRGENKEDDEIKRNELSAFADGLNELKLAVLPLAERSGMQLTGKKDANAQQPDSRSPVELGLCEEVYEATDDFFRGIEDRMGRLRARDRRLISTLGQLRDLLVELHERNLSTLRDLGCQRPDITRKRTAREEIRRDANANALPEEAAPASESFTMQSPRSGPYSRGQGNQGGRVDLMSAIAGRGGGGRENQGGRGDLMSAIAGRGGGGRESQGGRGDLMSAIAGRGGGGRENQGGRGDLMSAIAGRGGGDKGSQGGINDVKSATSRTYQSVTQDQAYSSASNDDEARGPSTTRKKPKGRGDFLASIGALDGFS